MKREQESIFVILERSFRQVLHILICIYMLLILVGLPFYNEEGYTHIGTDKATFFRMTVKPCATTMLIVVGCCLLCKGIIFMTARKAEKSGRVKAQIGKKVSVTDWFAIGYCICVVLSYLFTNYRDEGLWGTRGWFMGMIPQLAVVGSYFLISRAWKNQKWVLPLILCVSAVVFTLGYLDRFGVHLLDMKVDNASFISTIGNINWYCGYVMCVFFVGYGLLWKKDFEKLWQKIFLMVYVTIGFATLLTQGSISGVVALGVILLVTFFLSAEDGKRMEMFWLEMILFSVACGFTYLMCLVGVFTVTYKFEATVLYTNILVVALLTAVSVLAYGWVVSCNRRNCYPGKLLSGVAKVLIVGVPAFVAAFLILVAVNTVSGGIVYKLTGMSENSFLTFTPRWGSNRGATYLAGLMSFGEQNLLHKLTGVGPDCMATFLYTDGSEELVAMVKSVFGNARLTNAHNEWLTILVNIGLPGCICFVGMVLSAIYRFIKKREKSVVALACGFCLLAYTVNNMFSFQQTMSLATIFVVWGIGENYLRAAEEA